MISRYTKRPKETQMSALVSTLAAALLATVLSLPAIAHETGVATLTLDLQDRDQPQLHVELDVLDIELAVGLDDNEDGSVTWGEYTAQQLAIERYIGQSLRFSVVDRACSLNPISESSGIRQGITPSVITVFRLSCPEPISTIRVDNRLLQEIDSVAQALFVILGSGDQKPLLISQGKTTVDIADAGFTKSLTTLFTTGTQHLLGGLNL